MFTQNSFSKLRNLKNQINRENQINQSIEIKKQINIKFSVLEIPFFLTLLVVGYDYGEWFLNFYLPEKIRNEKKIPINKF